MTKNQAIKTARDRIRLVGFGRGEWAIEWHDVARDATWHSEHMDYVHACAYRRVALLEEALELLGVPDPGMIAAALAQQGGRWTDLIPTTADSAHGSDEPGQRCTVPKLGSG